MSSPESSASLPSAKLALEAGLARATLTLSQAAEHVGADRRLDLRGTPGGALGLLLAEAWHTHQRPLLVVTSDVDAMRRTAADLEFFLASGADDATEVLRYPGSELSAFVEAAPDRRAELERMATLAALSSRPESALVVTTASALVRRVPPCDAVRRACLTVRVHDTLDREVLIEALVRAGYFRVPLVEDPGTFAVRGALVDVFPVGAEQPVRIDLDDDLVETLRHFDPDDQRTRGEVQSLVVSPVRPVQFAGEAGKQARARVTDLCDSLNMPTGKRRALIDELEMGRQHLGIDALLPAAYDEPLDSLFDYLHDRTAVVVADPTAVAREAHECLETAHADYAERGDLPAYPVEALYLDLHALADALDHEALTVVHRLAVGGAPQEDESPLSVLESTGDAPAESLGGEDHAGLTATLKARRKTGGRLDALEPLADQVRGYLEGGMRVLLSARTATQGERMASLLRGYQVPVTRKPEAFRRELLQRAVGGAAQVVLGPLSEGFVLASAGLVCLTEAEIFGARPPRPKRNRQSARSAHDALEDLRELSVGDFVVHVEHGIGRYKGLEKKVVPLSRYEQLQGMRPVGVEVLAIEYVGGTLYLPVTRLNQVQKHSGSEGKPPKLDKLGGQTFAKTKQRVRGEVRKLADDLLKIYAERAANTRPPLPSPGRTYAEFEAGFPYDETPDQARAIDDVLADLERPQAMDRVVCGDVGFGKTEVAMRAAFRAAMAGRQVALLCPTTVLAQQHLLTFRERMGDYALEVEGLSRFVPRKEQTQVLRRLKEGKVDIVVGTHRLLGKDVHFRNLGLLVVDEEQRFGVTHKERIKAMRAQVDVLTLSATPIPRTLQMAVTGLRDLSLITTPPVDRRAIRTFVTRWDERVVREAIERELSRGGQVFFVHNRVDSLHERAARLKELVPRARLVVAHGQMTEATLERVMADFVDGQADVLCSTAIVESGLDIPRANTILIDRADHYGLAQLYQLRGRVGRGRERAYCYLIAPPPAAMSEEARSRIEALERFTELGSGFKVASLDLELRGAGDLLGAEQSGNVSAVGFDLFVQMLHEAVAELEGHARAPDVDTELHFDLPLTIPDDYVEDVGVRLSLYKRLGGAETPDDVRAIGQEMEDRFGPPPDEAVTFVRAMALKPRLRALRALGCEASASRVSLHLAEDAPIDTQSLLPWVAAQKPRVTLSPNGKLTLRFDENAPGDSIERVERALDELHPHLQKRPEP